MQEKIKIIADHFGEECQKKKLQEELMELAVADSHKSNKEFRSECADVIILMCQRAHQRGIKDEKMEEMIDFKLDRTLDRIEEGYYDNIQK